MNPILLGNGRIVSENRVSEKYREDVVVDKASASTKTGK